MKEFGFIRETLKAALKDGADKSTGICRTGLEEYLKVIFPLTNDWIHDKSIKGVNGIMENIRPDYRSESLKIIIEYDGIFHYKYPQYYLDDKKKTKIYESAGYKVIRIPYFIQLTKESVKELFGLDIDFELFNADIPSMSIEEQNTPAYMCYYGVMKMNEDFTKSPSQKIVNLKYLESISKIDVKHKILSGYDLIV